MVEYYQEQHAYEVLSNAVNVYNLGQVIRNRSAGFMRIECKSPSTRYSVIHSFRFTISIFSYCYRQNYEHEKIC